MRNTYDPKSSKFNPRVLQHSKKYEGFDVTQASREFNQSMGELKMNKYQKTVE